MAARIDTIGRRAVRRGRDAAEEVTASVTERPADAAPRGDILPSDSLIARLQIREGGGRRWS
jgi:hypothetical protein